MTMPSSSVRLSCSEKSATCWRNSSTDGSSAWRVVLARDADELLEVLEPALGLDRPLGLQRVGVAGLGERLLEQVADRRGAVGALAQALHHRHEAVHRLDRGRARARGCPRASRATSQIASPIVFAWPAIRACVVSPIPRRGELTIALERDQVLRVDEERQVAERVLDLRALVEARAADHLVADAVADERVLEHAALRVRAVEDGDLVARAAGVHEPLDLAGDVARLGVLVLELADRDQVARRPRRSRGSSPSASGCSRSARWPPRGSSASSGSSARA